MNPVFNEYITFLRDNTNEKLEDLKQGYFWLDKQIIKGFDKQGNIHKFYKINVSDDLQVSLSKPKTGYDNIKDVELISWNELANMNKQSLRERERELRINKFCD